MLPDCLSRIRPALIIARFTVNCEPVPKARARITSRRNPLTRETKTWGYTPDATAAAENRLIVEFRRAAGPGGWPYPQGDPGGWFGVGLLFVTRKAAKDADNLEKLVFDALSRVVWRDDRQITEQHVRKRVGPNARTEILIYRTQPPEDTV